MNTSSLKLAAILLTVNYMAEQAFAVNSSVPVAPAEQQSIIGKVIDADGEAVIGAHVLIKGYIGRGTATDANGQFLLNVVEGTLLEVSYLGFHSIEVKASNGMVVKFAADQQIEELNEVVVQGVKAQKNAPFAVANMDREVLDAYSKSGKELPMLFTQTPGVQAWGENGLGTGSVYMRIRGAGDSRINVTLDGVPMNSPEDQCVFWANMNSYGSLLGNVQIQRGVGTSTNGDGAFGGTIALTSKAPSTQAGGEFSYSYGSYNTQNIGGNFTTGLMGKHLIFDGAYHETNTDGYMHGTSGRSGSYYGGLAWMGKNLIVRYKNFGNFEKTGQAWNGATTGDDDNSMLTAIDWTDCSVHQRISGYKEMYDKGLGKYNSLYEHLIPTDNGDWQKDANGNYLTERYRMSDGSYWPKATDNFWQNRSILSMAWKVNDRWNTSASLHYTHGYGYYNEFRPNNKFTKFGLPKTFTFSDNETTIKKSDFVRKKGMTQDCYGLVWNANYKHEPWDITSGLSLQQFKANHFGYVTYVGSYTLSAQQNKELNDKIRPGGKDYQYYDSDATKNDGSAFIKALYSLNEQWSVMGDLQYRHVGYTTDGLNDRYYDNDNSKQMLDIDKQYDFLNPKAGINWHREGHTAFASFAWSHREPERNNFTDNGSYPAPKAEQLFDYEIGYSFKNESWNIDVNGYFMNYKDQFVQTGEKSDIGESLTTNIAKSYRAGIELAAAWMATPWLTIEANTAISANKIKDFDEYVDNWEGDPVVVHYDDSDLAMSPSLMFNGFITYHQKGLNATWHTSFVGKQYLDNTSCDARSLPSYCVSNLSINYTIDCSKYLKAIVLSANLNNLFDKHYAASGWVYSALEEYAGLGSPDNRYNQIGYIPQAGFTAMGCITVKF